MRGNWILGKVKLIHGVYLLMGCLFSDWLAQDIQMEAPQTLSQATRCNDQDSAGKQNTQGAP